MQANIYFYFVLVAISSAIGEDEFHGRGQHHFLFRSHFVRNQHVPAKQLIKPDMGAMKDSL